MSDNTPIGRIVKLRSPFNGEEFLMEFVPGRVPTLETMLNAKFLLVEDEPVKTKGKRAD